MTTWRQIWIARADPPDREFRVQGQGTETPIGMGRFDTFGTLFDGYVVDGQIVLCNPRTHRPLKIFTSEPGLALYLAQFGGKDCIVTL